MKKILILFLFLPLFSCDDWLTVEPQNSITYTNYFKSEKDLQSLYLSMQTRMKRVCFGKNPYFYISIDADQVDANIAGYRELDTKLNLAAAGGGAISNWKIFYDVIYLANLMIENEGRFQNIPQDRAEFWLGQAHFAKALTYFRLAQIWGDAPISQNTESTDPIGKSSALGVLEEAAREAKAALVLPAFDQLVDADGDKITTRQYGSLGAANTLLANIYAWMGGLTGKREHWELAEIYASEVIDGKAGAYDLESMEGLIKNTFGKTRSDVETIYAIANSALDSDRSQREDFSRDVPGHYMMSYPYTTTDPAAVRVLETSTEKNIYRILVETVEVMYPEENDLRRKEFWYQLGELMYVNEDGMKTIAKYAYVSKWRDVITQTNDDVLQGSHPVIAVDADYCFWRLADLILLRAECRARLGLPTAVDDLDRIRERAGLDKYAGSTDKEDLRREIFEERRRELYGEGQYYFDIVRNRYHEDYLFGEFLNLTESDIENGAFYTIVGDNAFEKNTLMTQNTYWQWKM